MENFEENGQVFEKEEGKTQEPVLNRAEPPVTETPSAEPAVQMPQAEPPVQAAQTEPPAQAQPVIQTPPVAPVQQTPPVAPSPPFYAQQPSAGAPVAPPAPNAYYAAPKPAYNTAPTEVPKNPLYPERLGKVTYSPKAPVNDYRPFSKGLKIFCAALVAVIIFTAACAGGYYIGRSGNSADSKYYKSDVKVDLAAKPKDQDGMTTAEVYEAVNPSVVGVRVYNSSTATESSGVIYTEDGYVITNDHIYETVGAPKFRIYTYDGKEYDAEYVAGDIVSDLAVLKIKNGKNLKPATFGNSKELVCGENVFAVGRTSDASDLSSITAGTVSLTSRRVKSRTNYSSALIQTDSAINPGSSGGALSNMYGQIVGITSSKLAGSEYDRIGFAIPSYTVKRVVDQLISKGKVTDRAKIGITYTEINSVTKKMGNYAAVGLLIDSVGEDSSLSGKVKKGDIITHVNGKEITKDDIMLDVIESSKAGDEIEVTVLSSGNETDYTVKLGANVGESSYKSEESAADNSSENEDSSDSDGTFDFPFGY